MSDEEDDDFDDQSSISDDADFSDSGSESFPDTESTGPSEATTDDMQWDRRMRAPTLGLRAHSKRVSLEMKSRQQYEQHHHHHNRNFVHSYDDITGIDGADESSALYSRIERREHRRDDRRDRDHHHHRRHHQEQQSSRFRVPRQPRGGNKENGGLTVIEELSPIRSDSQSMNSSDVPPPMPLRCKAEWNPQLTSTTTSFQPLVPLLPKTNPHFAPQHLMSSTPRRSASDQHLAPAAVEASSNRRYHKKNQRPMPPHFDDITESLTGESDYESPIPWNHPMSQPSSQPTYFRPEHFGLPSALAKNLGINGIVFLSMSLSGRRLTINVQRGVYFRDPSQSQICSYLRAELRHRGRSHSHAKRYCSSSLAARQHGQSSRYEETYRTRLVATTNRPTFQESFTFKLAENCGRDYLVLTVYAMDANETQKKKVLGCMAFPISRILKKARATNADYFYYQAESDAMEEVEINNEGYFLLDPRHGEKRNLPQSKVKRQTYYNDPTLSGTTSGSSFTSQGKMTAASSRLSVPNELSHGDYFCSTSDLRVHPNPMHNLDYTSASSSTTGSTSALNHAAIALATNNGNHMHHGTVPSITTTTASENTTDEGSSSSGPAPQPAAQPANVDHHFLYAENGGVYGAGPPRDVGASSSSKASSSSGLSVRRAASFTFSPKGSSAKNNQRPVQMRDEEKKEKKFFGPISKTLSFLRNKMDFVSTSTLFPSRDEVRQWETSFDSLLNNKFGCTLFRQFLKKEFSDENVDFWVECEDFKKMKDGKKATAARALEIYRTFVVEHAPKEVNLDSDTRAATKAAVENGGRTDAFSLAQNRVEQLMSKDSYRRFLRDRLFLDLLESYETKEKEAAPKDN